MGDEELMFVLSDVVCPKCESDTYEVCSTTTVTDPYEGQQVAWQTTLECGCTVNDYYVWYAEMGWV